MTVQKWFQMTTKRINTQINCKIQWLSSPWEISRVAKGIVSFYCYSKSLRNYLNSVSLSFNIHSQKSRWHLTNSLSLTTACNAQAPHTVKKKAYDMTQNEHIKCVQLLIGDVFLQSAQLNRMLYKILLARRCPIQIYKMSPCFFLLLWWLQEIFAEKSKGKAGFLQIIFYSFVLNFYSLVISLFHPCLTHKFAFIFRVGRVKLLVNTW